MEAPTVGVDFSRSRREVDSVGDTAAQILGWDAGGKTRGKWESGKVAKMRFPNFLDFHVWIFFFEK